MATQLQSSTIMKSGVVFVFLCFFSLVVSAETNSSIVKRKDAIEQKIKEGERVAAYEFTPMPLLNDLTSDALTLFELHKTTKPISMSKRLQVCTTNLINAAYLPGILTTISPMQHMGILIDGKEKFTDPGGGGLQNAQELNRPIVCSSAPSYSTLNDDQLVKLVSCMAENYRDIAPYRFFAYNCAGFTRDILLASGMDIPVVPNLGIGMWANHHFSQDVATEINKARATLFNKIAPRCWGNL